MRVLFDERDFRVTAKPAGVDGHMMTPPLSLPAPLDRIFGSLFGKPLALLDRHNWIGPLALRLVIGIAFISTGWSKLHNLEQVTGFFKSLGIPAAELQAPMVATIELAGGLLLLLGLGTRLAAALLIGVMSVALATAIIPNAAGLTAILGSIEAMYLAVFVYLAASGGGAASLDRVLVGALRRNASSQASPAAASG